MKTPPFLIGASLLLWGWQTQLLYVAVPMAAVLEGSRLLKARWEFSESDIRHVSDLCTIILAMVVVLALGKAADRFLMITIQWLPLVVFPLIAVQQYSRLGMIHGYAMLFLLRRKPARANRRNPIFNIAYPYFGLCIISAAAVNAHRTGFYGCLMALLLWALWPLRSRRYPGYVWISLLIAGGVVGYGGQLGLFQLQHLVTRMVYHYYLRASEDPFKSITAIGDVGALKTSSRIIFRVRADDPRQWPILLRQASYTVYEASSWYATHAGFDDIAAQRARGSWDIGGHPRDARTLYFAMDLPKGKHLLKLPGGTFRLEHLDVAGLQRNSLGALRTVNEAGLRQFEAVYDPSQSFNRPPEDGDLRIPAQEAPAVNTVATSLGLTSKPPADALSAIHAFFIQHFHYSMALEASRPTRTGLADFLLRSRTGHCEYFATATVFLLRAAGIPARYVTGYAAGEYSSLENMLIVRQRHAHAWAIAYVAGRWVDVDNTPPDWSAIESARASMLVSVSDLLSFLSFRFARWRQEVGLEELTPYLILPLLVLVIIYIRRLSGKKRPGRVTDGAPEEDVEAVSPGASSAFRAIELWLNGQGYHRPPGETLHSWCERLSAHAPQIVSMQEIGPVLFLHYRYRFAPEELSRNDLETLDAGVRAIIDRKVCR